MPQQVASARFFVAMIFMHSKVSITWVNVTLMGPVARAPTSCATRHLTEKVSMWVCDWMLVWSSPSCSASGQETTTWHFTEPGLRLTVTL